MSLEVAKEWHKAPALPKLCKAPAEWPTEIHSQISFAKGPGDSHFAAFMRASRLRGLAYEFLHPRSDQLARPEFNFSPEGSVFHF